MQRLRILESSALMVVEVKPGKDLAFPSRNLGSMQKFCDWCGNRPATDTHHLFRRSTSPELVAEKANLIDLCRICHDIATKSLAFEKLLQEYFFAKQDQPALSLANIAQKMRDMEYLSPRDIDRYRRFLAGWYAFLSEEWRIQEMNRPEVWSELREGVKSDNRADRMYDATPAGLKQIGLKSEMKVIEKMLSSLKGAHEQYQKEGYNSF